MCDSLEECSEIFSQDGVMLKQAPANYINFVNTIGTFYISLTSSPSNKKFIEWKPNDVTIDSDIQDQEWAVVNTIQKRSRTFSGSLPPEYGNRSRLRLSFDDFKSFRIQQKYRQLTFYDGQSEPLCKFWFQHGDCEILVITIKSMLKTAPSKRDKNLFVVLDQTSLEYQQIDRSFAELNIPNDGHTIWRFMKNLREQPYEATLEAFAKVTDYGKQYFVICKIGG